MQKQLNLTITYHCVIKSHVLFKYFTKYKPYLKRQKYLTYLCIEKPLILEPQGAQLFKNKNDYRVLSLMVCLKNCGLLKNKALQVNFKYALSEMLIFF